MYKISPRHALALSLVSHYLVSLVAFDSFLKLQVFNHCFLFFTGLMNMMGAFTGMYLPMILIAPVIIKWNYDKCHSQMRP